MKYLTDSEILKWNDRFEKSNFRLIPRYNTRNGHPDISINYITTPFSGLSEIKETPDTVISYEFSFSVIESRKDEFYILLKKMFNYKFETQISYNDSSKSIDIFNEKDIIKEEVNHQLLNRKFIKYTLKFKGKLSSIIAYLSYVEDAINFFQLIWGYNEEGEEICLTKYRIGDIVSVKNDKSKDFLVVDYYYNRIGNDYKINYVISEMISNSNSSIIRYGDGLKESEDNLTYSRNNRIDDILN
jgi:hypothetical protein